jgi:hypothetical protein
LYPGSVKGGSRTSLELVVPRDRNEATSLLSFLVRVAFAVPSRRNHLRARGSSCAQMTNEPTPRTAINGVTRSVPGGNAAGYNRCPNNLSTRLNRAATHSHLPSRRNLRTTKELGEEWVIGAGLSSTIGSANLIEVDVEGAEIVIEAAILEFDRSSFSDHFGGGVRW